MKKLKKEAKKLLEELITNAYFDSDFSTNRPYELIELAKTLGFKNFEDKIKKLY